MKKDADLRWLDSLTAIPNLRSEDYEFAGDRDALAAFKSVPGAAILCSKWVEFWLEFRKTGFLGSSIKVSEKQFPEVDRLRRKAAEVLLLTPPPVFIVEQPVINAYTMGTDQDNSFVAITRPLLEAATERELMFILGHEFGHIKSQHALYGTIAIFLANMGLFYGNRFLPIYLLTYLVYPLELALKAWFRRSEITCDRAGLVCAQDLDSARRALLLLGCCSRELADRIDLDEFRKQSEEVSRSYGKWSEMLLTHPYLPKRIRCLEVFGDSELFVRRVRGEKKGRFLDPEDVDKATAKILGNETPEVRMVAESGDEARLKAVLALAGAWHDGRMSAPRRKALESLLGGLDLKSKEAKALRAQLDAPLAETAALREVKYFSGDRLQALPYAFSYLLLDSEGPGHRQIRFLLELVKACGVGAEQAEGIVFEIGTRKLFFRDLCGTEFCARCARLFAKGTPACPDCGAETAELEVPEKLRVKRLSERAEELARAAARSARGAGGELLRSLARGLQAGAALLGSEPAPEPKPKRGRKKK